MKYTLHRWITLLTVLLLLCCICVPAGAASLKSAAKAEGELIVYGSVSEYYLAEVCARFEKKYGIHVTRYHLSAGEAIALAHDGSGADVWFGGSVASYEAARMSGLLQPYTAKNASNLLDASYQDPDGAWYGIGRTVLALLVNTSLLDQKNLSVPKKWADLTKSKYKGLICVPSCYSSSAGRFFAMTMGQKMGDQKGLTYLRKLDRNVGVYTRSNTGPISQVVNATSAIGICYLQDALFQVIDLGQENLRAVLPSDGVGHDLQAAAIFAGAKHPNAARLWMEFVLTPECYRLGFQWGEYRLPVLKGVTLPKAMKSLNTKPNASFPVYTDNDFLQKVQNKLNPEDPRLEY